MKAHRSVHTPLNDEVIMNLHAGDQIFLSGTVYTARDKAHERIKKIIESNGSLPFNLTGELIYYVGPSPAREGKMIGSAGPTTSSRMDPFSEMMLSLGIKGMIGKGRRDAHTIALLKKWNAVYFGTFGGAGAFLSKRIVASEIVVFEDLGPEAVYKLEVKDFPIIVINDIYDGDLYEHALAHSR